MGELPGGKIGSRPLHFFLILDCSGSMNVDGKIQALNHAIHEAIPHMQTVQEENPFGELLVRAISFSDGAQWVISQPTPVKDFRWTDMEADGLTDMGKAFTMVADQLKMPPMPNRALPPALVLISDGQPTDDFASGLKALNETSWGKKTVRVAIAIGGDADHGVLQKFLGNPEMKVLQANNADRLAQLIKWASTVVTQSVVKPDSKPKDATPSGGVVPIPAAPEPGPESADDVW
jgi:uncharacterized protein YegL